MNFIDALMEEFRADPAAIAFADDLHQVLVRAANNVVDEDEMEIRIWREIEPEDMIPITIIELEGILAAIRLWPEDVALLRALLLSYDEKKPVAVGEPLSMATRLKDGRVVSIVVEEMIK